MPISATDPIAPAITRTKWMMFKPFDIGKWFTLGFCAFLASLAEGGGGGANLNIPSGRARPVPAPPVPGIPRPPGVPAAPRVPGFPGTPGTPGGRSSSESFADFLQQMWQQFLDNAYWILPVAVLSLALMAVIMWVRARGKFMFLDGVVQDRGAVVEPWKRFRGLANSFFRFDLLLTAIAILFLAALLAGALLLALPDIRADRMGGAGAAAILLGVLLFIPGILALLIAKAIAEDFRIPLMYLRGQPIGAAWREFRSVLLPGNLGTFVLFYLMRFVLAIATGIIALLAMCATCCIAGLPYISNVVLLPLFVFHRLYPLYFLRQFGGDYNLLNDPAPVIGFPVIPPPPPPLPGGFA